VQFAHAGAGSKERLIALQREIMFQLNETAGVTFSIAKSLRWKI
jgi:hypothetical protein